MTSRRAGFQHPDTGVWVEVTWDGTHVCFEAVDESAGEDLGVSALLETENLIRAQVGSLERHARSLAVAEAIASTVADEQWEGWE